MNTRTSKKEVQDLIALCRDEGLDLRPKMDTRRPFIVLQYIAYENSAQPKILRFATLNEAKEYFEQVWREAVAFNSINDE